MKACPPFDQWPSTAMSWCYLCEFVEPWNVAVMDVEGESTEVCKACGGRCVGHPDFAVESELEKARRELAAMRDAVVSAIGHLESGCPNTQALIALRRVCPS